MKFTTDSQETIFVSEITPAESYMFDDDLKMGLSIIWVRTGMARLMIDKEVMFIGENTAIFLTEYHQIDDFDFERMNVIQFNRQFYCIDEGDSETGCKGLLFFSASQIPKITIPESKARAFDILWEILVMEMAEKDKLKLELLRVLLKRFLILFLRVYKNENDQIPADDVGGGVIREFNYLVEQHFRLLTKVSDYARLLHKSPKTLSNLELVWDF